ncbi:uroporphyrinogen decarboxylase family protein [Paludicola sp. MB14-C6]|uniref:uroporphyrinogen decarboxylase family protein n=1 Tax=Paludihabitans sp. MB14-C6 TaxID=3070656 RepID=UPI0027DC5863|nr:uroporphyrinogen decarboxylase family protein [Paludicola sp. MB14-C6]WMJ23187.1 uroporphyrinogen decarboxylase family protein [Paludicola sp. MB14-C6]
MEMTPKQRLLSSIKGEQVDRPAFSPFLAYYFQSLPLEIQQAGELAYLQQMGADPLLRGAVCAYKYRHKVCSVNEVILDDKKIVTWITPKGTLYAEYIFAKKSNTWYLTRHPVQRVEDIACLKAYYEDIIVVENIEESNAQVEQLGGNGLQLAILGIEQKSSFQSLLEFWIGTINLIYFCEDEPELIADLLSVMQEKSRKTVEITANSKVSACISWEDSSTGNISPSMYQEFIAPELSNWCDILHNENKLYVQHACGLIKDLLIPMGKQGVDAIESITPPNTGNVTIAEANRILPTNISLIGGIDPVFLLNSSKSQLEKEAVDLIKTCSNRGFVLANSDSCPPGVDYDKFLALSQLVRTKL